MKIFQTLRKHLAAIAYRPNQSPFNSDISHQCVKSILFIFGQCMYLFRLTNSATEFIYSIFVTATGLLILSSFLSTTCKMEIIFVFIEETEGVINESEFT